MRHLITALMLSCFALPVYAGTGVAHSSANIRITGRLQPPPPCKVNNNEEILVDFQRIQIKTLEKSDIRKDVDIPFVCEQDSENFKYFLTVDGPRAQFNNKLVKTNQNNLGFTAELAGVRLDLGKAHPVNSHHLTLTIVLTKNPAGDVTPGAFSGTGTVTMEYF
ncbi:fimbrial protein [Morganella morganii]|uniref:fimbrial protein n=1 Tax=Morganella morganii TaxID=582 RepID=UPI00116324B6|nr:fimbrial protein [Morganella morganii]QQO72282.1 fimbrial protein [Morganella morganii]